MMRSFTEAVEYCEEKVNYLVLEQPELVLVFLLGNFLVIACIWEVYALLGYSLPINILGSVWVWICCLSLVLSAGVKLDDSSNIYS